MYHPADVLLEEILKYVKPHPRVTGAWFFNKIVIYMTLDATLSGEGIHLTFDKNELVIAYCKTKKYLYADPNEFVPEKIGAYISELLVESLSHLQRQGRRTVLDRCYGHSALCAYLHHLKTAESRSEASAPQS